VSEVKNPALYGDGLVKIDWVKRFMPVCGELEKAYAKEKPFQGLTIAMCIHLEAKTARLALLLRDAGAKVVVTGSNPLSTQDDVAAALEHEGLEVFAWRGETQQEYEQNLQHLLSFNPDLILDDGFDLTTMLVERFPEKAEKVIGVTEETTTGLIRARNMAKAGKLPFPVMAVNDARVKHLFDNRYGTENPLSTVSCTTRIYSLVVRPSWWQVSVLLAEVLLRNSKVWGRRSLSQKLTQ